MPETAESEDLVWGSAGIAKAVNRPYETVRHMLKRNTLPGAVRIGGRWAFSKRKFYELTFEKADAA
jgi:hypothetical protein